MKPFCHLPGTACVIPQTTTQVQAFPTLLRFTDLSSGKTWDEKLPWKGPVEGFTLELDLDKGCLQVFGKTAEGFRRHVIKDCWTSAPVEKLSLGKHTKLDWELVTRRMNMEEMVPILFLLGQTVQDASAKSPILELLKFDDKVEVTHQLQLFFKAGFQGILTPRLTDGDFQGIVTEGPVEGSPLALLRSGYEAVRALLFIEDNGFSFLPNLPPEFHAGHLQVRTHAGDLVSMEWSKKLLKNVLIKPAMTREIPLTFQKSLHSFRVNKKSKHDVKKPLSLIEGQTVFLDRFEK